MSHLTFSTAITEKNNHPILKKTPINPNRRKRRHRRPNFSYFSLTWESTTLTAALLSTFPGKHSHSSSTSQVKEYTKASWRTHTISLTAIIFSFQMPSPLQHFSFPPLPFLLGFFSLLLLTNQYDFSTTMFIREPLLMPAEVFSSTWLGLSNLGEHVFIKKIRFRKTILQWTFRNITEFKILLTKL